MDAVADSLYTAPLIVGCGKIHFDSLMKFTSPAISDGPAAWQKFLHNEALYTL
jgi:hypothetical protein